MSFVFEDISGRRPRFRVFTQTDGVATLVGQVEHKWFRHIRQYGWEATAVDGSHRAVHEEQWQAAWALTWDGKGYPFPVTRRHPPA
jgi:hypothetical protein